MITNFLGELSRIVLIMSASGSLLILLLLLIKPAVRHRLPMTAQYCFWFVALGALLIPVSRIVVLPENSAAVAPIYGVVERNFVLPQGTNNFLELDFDIADSHTEQLHVPTPQEGGKPPLTAFVVFVYIYPFGVLGILLYSLVGYARMLKKIRRGYLPPAARVSEMLTELAGKRVPKIFVSDFALTPMLIGLFVPKIVLPNREYTDAQLRGILLHELTHMRRLDIAIKWLSLFSCALHWFNPLVWVARREIDRLCELSCDEAVIRNMDANGKQSYGETLISVASEKKIPLPILSTTMCEEKRVMKERLGAIMKSKKHTKFAVLISVFIIFAAAITAFALGAANAPEEEQGEYATHPTAATEAYAAILRKYSAAHGENMFFVPFDIDRDGTVELIIMVENSETRDLVESFYTFRDGEVFALGYNGRFSFASFALDANTTIMSDDYEGIILSMRVSPGGYFGRDILRLRLVIDGDTLVISQDASVRVDNEGVWEIDFNSLSEEEIRAMRMERTTFILNGETITEEEFLSLFTSFETIVPTRITEENIAEAVRNGFVSGRGIEAITQAEFLGENESVTVNAERAVFSYTPILTGTYLFAVTESEGEPVLEMYNAAGEQIAVGEYSSGYVNLVMYAELTAGQSYTLVAGSDGGITFHSLSPIVGGWFNHDSSMSFGFNRDWTFYDFELEAQGYYEIAGDTIHLRYENGTDISFRFDFRGDSMTLYGDDFSEELYFIRQ